MKQYSSDPTPTAVEGLSRAQELVFAPITFQATRLLCKLNILSVIEEAGQEGIALEVIAQACELSEYGVDVLLSMGLSAGVVYKKDDNFVLARIGYFLLNDEMTRVNMAFTNDVCYEAMFHLEDAIREGKPSGLKVFGDWPTVYEGLTRLPEPARTSWFDFDHFYSDGAFDDALDIVFSHKPKTLFDVGGNTGKWSLACARHDENVHVTLFDLPQQLELAGENVEKAGFSDRVSCYAMNMLDNSRAFPGKADAIWMSQFLDCFSPQEILSILMRATEAMNEESSLFIMETLWDCQDFDAASYSLNATSLYFTALANGNSRMYGVKQFSGLIAAAGLEIEERIDGVGFCHSIFRCRLAKA